MRKKREKRAKNTPMEKKEEKILKKMIKIGADCHSANVS